MFVPSSYFCLLGNSSLAIPFLFVDFLPLKFLFQYLVCHYLSASFSLTSLASSISSSSSLLPQYSIIMSDSSESSLLSLKSWHLKTTFFPVFWVFHFCVLFFLLLASIYCRLFCFSPQSYFFGFLVFQVHFIVCCFQ